MDYRLYFIDQHGRISRHRAFACETDEEAIQFVEQHHSDHEVELWEHARLVRRLKPEP